MSPLHDCTPEAPEEEPQKEKSAPPKAVGRERRRGRRRRRRDIGGNGWERGKGELPVGR